MAVSWRNYHLNMGLSTKWAIPWTDTRPNLTLSTKMAVTLGKCNSLQITDLPVLRAALMQHVKSPSD